MIALKDLLKHTEELATISPAAVELLHKINSPEITRQEIYKLVSMDEVLYANLFKAVNSAAIGLSRKAQSVAEAVDILGLNGLRNLVFMVAAKKVFVDLELWHKSVFIAFTAQRLAEKIPLKPNQVSNIYIAGLMQSIGELVFKMFYKKHYDEIILFEDIDERKNRERAIFGLSSEELAFEIVKQYGLPESIVKIMENQSKSWDDEAFMIENALINTASSLSELTLDDIQDQESINEKINFEILDKFSLKNFDINPDLLIKLHEETDNFVAAKI